jgi:hypothetical protein
MPPQRLRIEPGGDWSAVGSGTHSVVSRQDRPKPFRHGAGRLLTDRMRPRRRASRRDMFARPTHRQFELAVNALLILSGAGLML